MAVVVVEVPQAPPTPLWPLHHLRLVVAAESVKNLILAQRPPQKLAPCFPEFVRPTIRNTLYEFPPLSEMNFEKNRQYTTHHKPLLQITKVLTPRKKQRLEIAVLGANIYMKLRMNSEQSCFENSSKKLIYKCVRKLERPCSENQ